MTLAAEDANFDIENGIIDSETPPHTLLAAEYKQSFAYYTFRVRLPSTLQTIADFLAKDKDELLVKYGADADIEQTAAAVLELRSNIRKNGPLLPFNDTEIDAGEWNAFLEQLPKEKRTYFAACWLYAECYMYRKIWSIFKGSRLAGYDYFRKQKQTAAQLSLDAMLAVAKGTRQNDRNSSTFQQLMKFNLWGNRCDLSITSGKQIKPTGDAFDQQVAELDDNLLVDATSSIWDALDKSDGNGIVEFIFDNSGYELYTDLILAEYIIDKGLAKKVRFNAKAIPWFISDVMEQDYHWTLQFLIDQTDSVLSDLGKKLKRFTDEGKFELAPLEHFWTSPYEFYRMAEVRPELYKRLSLAQLVIFKGDLNYRKLLGDYSWHSTEAFETCLRGFRPTNVCTLRTIKADLVCGLPEGKSKELYAKNKEWMLTGEYGIIQFASK